MNTDLPKLEPAELVTEAAIEPPQPPPRAVKLIEIIWTLNDEAERIENAQNAMILAGIQEKQHAGQMDRAHVLRTGARMLAEIEHNWPEHKKLIAARRQRGKRT